MAPPNLSTRLPRVSAVVARRLLMGAQGLLDDPRGPVTADRLYGLIERMGFVQIDSINIVERAHHLTLLSRLQGYRHSLLDRLLERQRRLFEHWTHDASAVPSIWYPYWKIRFERYRRRVLEHPWWMERIGPEPERAVEHVRERLLKEGPLRARDFEDTRGADAERTWWGWKPQKAALEYLWRTGEVAIAGRDSFHKVYDLTERILPDLHAAPAPDPGQHLAWAGRTALERLGIATPGEIASFWAAVSPEEAKTWSRGAVERGEAVEVEVEAVDGSRPQRALAVPDWEARAAALPPAPPRLRLLSPFDPILRDRKRALRLFGFDYRFEAFVPEARRRHGYYVLPLLEGERLVGRVDPKLYRDEGVLDVRQVWWEPGVRESQGRKAALESAVIRLARAIGAESYRLPF